MWRRIKITYVLDSVGHARHDFLVAEAPYIDIDGSAGLVSLWIMDKENLELIFKADNSVSPVVQRRLL